MVTLGRFRSHLKQILHLQESPHRTALAFALGVFIAFSPTYGLHTLSVIFCTWAFRLNFLALMAGSLINNPWTVVPILGATFWTGFRVLGVPRTAPVSWDDLGLESLYEQVVPYALPFVIGGFALSLFGAALCYPAAYVFISRYRTRAARASASGERLPPSTDLG